MPAQITQNTQTQANPSPETQPIPKPVVEKDLFSWVAPSRPFKKRDREFWMTTIAGAGIFGVILFIIEGAMPVILIVAILFLFYILSTVEPEKIQYKITTQGVRIGNGLTEWNLINRFWFSNRLGSDLLIVETLNLPGRLELVVESKDKFSIEKALANYVIHEEAPPTNFDKASNWISSKLERS